MARHLNDEQLRELNHLKEWCTSILQFEKALYAPAPSEGGLLEIVERTYLERDLRGMRFLAKDLNEVPRGWWPSEKLRELNRLLKERFGEDLAGLKSRDLARVDRILKGGRIRSENEFRLVRERAEQIWDDDDKKEEMEALNKLLADFERPQQGSTPLPPLLLGWIFDLGGLEKTQRGFAPLHALCIFICRGLIHQAQ